MIAPRLATGFLGIGLAVAACAAPSRAQPSTTPHPAVCRIAVEERGGKAFGSGTLIDAREQYGLVITNWHVVRDATGKIEVTFPGGFKSEARPLKLDETWDLAALVVWRPATEPAPLAARSPRQGDLLTICGYGGGDYLSQTGRCTDYYAPEVGQPQDLVELNVEARQGDSGGPIFNSRGELAGVLFGAAQGTTLGSFGPRVQTFLASLAPDIGTERETLLAETTPAGPSRSGSLSPAAARPTRPVDPFLAAERAHPTPSGIGVRPEENFSAIAQATRPVPREHSVPPPALTDRSSAPRLAAAREKPPGWHSAERPQARSGGFDLPPQSSQVTGGFTPQSSAGSDEPPTQGTVDWTEEGRTLLAVLGAAALVVAGMRAIG